MFPNVFARNQGRDCMVTHGNKHDADLWRALMMSLSRGRQVHVRMRIMPTLPLAYRVPSPERDTSEHEIKIQGRWAHMGLVQHALQRTGTALQNYRHPLPLS